MFYREFVFGKRYIEGAVPVTARDLYSPEKGYGFVVERNRREQERLRVPELNSAFDAAAWYRDADLSHIREDEGGCFLDSAAEVARLEAEAGGKFAGESRRIPLSFKADVPSRGNYRVRVTLRGGGPGEDLLLFVGRRRLGFLGVSRGGGVYTAVVNVDDIIPRGHTRRFEDRTLDVTVVADRPGLAAVTVEEVACPTIYIAGDSTVTDQTADYPYAPGTSYSGWGQMLSGYLDTDVAVSNHAHSGLTTESFRGEGHYAILEGSLRKGDFLFCQFGHNDQKLDHLKAEEGYRGNLLRYIRESRAKGVFPVLVTPIARNTWKGNDGTYNDLLEAYAAACVRIGEQEDVPVADLHGRSMAFILEKGLEAAKAYFFPKDYTHSNDYGAYYMAGLVAEEIVRSCGCRREPEYRFLADRVTGGFGPWPPAGRIVPLERPAVYGEGMAEAHPLADVGRLSEPADRASVLDMVIRAAKFFPTNVYNDMFTDVVGHEWFAGTVECAYQNGMIDEGLVEDGQFFPLRPATLEELLVLALNGCRSRKALPALEGEEREKYSMYDGKCKEFAKPYVRAACALGLIAPDGSEDPGRGITRGEAVEICRKLF